MKRTLSLILALLMCVSLLPIGALADEEPEIVVQEEVLTDEAPDVIAGEETEIEEVPAAEVGEETTEPADEEMPAEEAEEPVIDEEPAAEAVEPVINEEPAAEAAEPVIDEAPVVVEEEPAPVPVETEEETVSAEASDAALELSPDGYAYGDISIDLTADSTSISKDDGSLMYYTFFTRGASGGQFTYDDEYQTYDLNKDGLDDVFVNMDYEHMTSLTVTKLNGLEAMREPGESGKATVDLDVTVGGDSHTGTLTIYFTQECWAVTLNGNGGAFYPGGDKYTLYVKKGERLDECWHYGHDISDVVDIEEGYSMTRPGYVCNGFSESESGPIIGCELDKYVPTGDVTLYAQWGAAVELTIDENYDGGGVRSINKGAGSVAIYAIEAAERFLRDGYVFDGFEAADGTTVATQTVDGLQAYIVPAANTTWKVKWKVPASATLTKDTTCVDKNYRFEGETAELYVIAAGPGLTYQWQKSLDDSSYSDIPGATGSRYSFPMTEEYEDSYFHCVVKDENGVTVTSAGKLMKLGGGVIEAPADYTGIPGENAVFSVKVSGRDKKYEWKAFKPDSTAVTLDSIGATGGDSATLTVPITASLDGYSFKCTVKWTVGGVEKTGYPNAATLHLGEVVPAVAFTVDPVPAAGKKIADVKATVPTGQHYGIYDAAWRSSEALPEKLEAMGISDLLTNTFPVSGDTFQRGSTYVLDVSFEPDAGYGMNAGTTVTLNGQAMRADRYRFDQIERRLHAYVLYTVPEDFADAVLTLTDTEFTYDGTAKQPRVNVKLGSKSLLKDTDYTVSYTDNVNAGTGTLIVTGKGNYSGTKSATFTIAPASLTGAAVTVPDQTYIGAALTPELNVTVGDRTLTADTDYTAVYANNVNVGAASVTITGKGNYTGTASGGFAIAKSKDSITAKDITKVYKAKAQSFSLGATTIGGKLTYKSNNKNITVSKTGKVTVKKGYVGKATITITSAATENCEKCVKKITVTVNPKGVKMSSVKNTAAKKVTAKWKKSASAKITGYQIQYSTKKDFSSGAKTVKVKGVKNVTKVISKLKKGQTYYVRVRTYQVVSKKTYYSAWSAAKAVKVKK